MASHMSVDAVSFLTDCDIPKCDRVKVIQCDKEHMTRKPQSLPVLACDGPLD